MSLAARAALVAAFLAMPAAAQPAAPAPPRDPAAVERMEIAAAAYHAIKRYFAHAEGLPAGYDLEASFRAYLAEALAAPDRRAFTIASSRFFAGLKNGHTVFIDRSLRAAAGAMPFAADRIEGGWTVTRSRLADLPPGAVIVMVDDVPAETWLAPARATIAVSNAAALDAQSWGSAWRLPARRFTLGLAGGARIAIDLDRPATGPERGMVLPKEVAITVRPDGVVVIRIPSFDAPGFEEMAITFVRANAGARAILFDVRGNGGGSTPVKLLAAIMTRPYAGTLVATPLTIARFDADAVFDPAADPIPRPMVRYGPEVTQPAADPVPVPMAVLADRGCGSACEDFVMRFQNGARGPVVGEVTVGSTGQPFVREWPALGLGFVVSTKREYFPDGRQFEGVGIAPDTPAPLTRAMLRGGPDTQLERAAAAVLAVPRPNG